MTTENQNIEQFLDELAEQLMQSEEYKPFIEQMKAQLDAMSPKDVHDAEQRLRRFYAEIVRQYNSEN